MQQRQRRCFAGGSSIPLPPTPPAFLPPPMGPSRFPGSHRGQRAVTFVLSLTLSSPKKKKEKIAASRGELGPVTFASSYGN